jgi:hypothetical protein
MLFLVLMMVGCCWKMMMLLMEDVDVVVAVKNR